MRPESYVWKSSTESLSIELALDVVQKLSLAAMEAFRAVPRRGLEIGGILLGRSETRRGVTTIQVLGFEPLESEYRSGPSFRLSEADLKGLDEALSRHPDAIGMYRTHTRTNTLASDEDDASTFNRCFTIPGRLLLLIQPVAWLAAFFLPRGGTLAPVHEFPFRVAELAAAGSAPEVHASTPRKRRWLIPAVAIGLGAIAGAAMLRFEYRRTPPAVPIIAHHPEEVALALKRDGGALRLLWDRESPTIRHADHAQLDIVDGNKKSQLKLDVTDLTTGSLSYWPQTGDVTFRLETFAGGRSSVSSIRAVEAEPTLAPPLAPPATAAREERSRLVPEPAKRPRPHPVEESRDTEIPYRRPSPFEPPVHLETTAPPAHPVPVPKRAPPQPAASLPPPPPAVERAPDPYVSVAAEPVVGSRLGRAIGRIPLLRRFKKKSQPYVPPQPVDQAEPVLTPVEKKAVTHSIPIDVKVYVTDSGQVDYAELLTDANDSNRDLASASVYAARRWRFTPARSGDTNVAGEVILHFRFRPEELSAVR